MRNRREEMKQMEEKMTAAIREAEKLKMEVDRVKRELAEMKAVPENCGIEDVKKAILERMYRNISQNEPGQTLPWMMLGFPAKVESCHISELADIYCKLDMHAKLAQGADVLLMLLKDAPDELMEAAAKNSVDISACANQLSKVLGVKDAIQL